MAVKIHGIPMAVDGATFAEKCSKLPWLSKPPYHFVVHRFKYFGNPSRTYPLNKLICLSYDNLPRFSAKTCYCMNLRKFSLVCHSNGTHHAKGRDCTVDSEVFCHVSSSPLGDRENQVSESPFLDHRTIFGSTSIYDDQGLAIICKFVHNDAKFMNERAQNDIGLLSSGITKLNDRARQDVAFLGLEILKIDARAREDAEKIDNDVKKKAAHLKYITMILKDTTQKKLKIVADEHWSDGALEADLRLADFCVRRRAREDAFLAMKFVKNIHDMMANKLYKQQPSRKQGSFSVNEVMGIITLEKNGRPFNPFPGNVSTERISAIQDAYWSMAAALSEADGIDYTNPEELELLVAALIDLDAMDGKSSVSLLAECANSPHVGTRQALANALATAPSIWILGNAGMGALQRLAEDSNPAVASAAAKAIEQLKQQWELQEGDSLSFQMKSFTNLEFDSEQDDDDVEHESL